MARNRVLPVTQETVCNIAQQNYDNQLRHNKRVAAWNTFSNNATFIAFTGAFSALCVVSVLFSPVAYLCIKELKAELKEVYERELAHENFRTLREFEIALAEPELRPSNGPMYRAWEEDGEPPSYAATVGEPPSYAEAILPPPPQPEPPSYAEAILPPPPQPEPPPEYYYDDVSMISFDMTDADS